MGKEDQTPGERPPMGERPEPKPLTDAQKKSARDIFAQYDVARLTADDAQAIIKALEAAGIKGPDVFGAIKEAGVDPETFGKLAGFGAPPPGGHGGHGGPGGHMPPPPGGQPGEKEV